MSQLRHQLKQIVADFASAVIAAMNTASMREFVRGSDATSARHAAPQRRNGRAISQPASNGGRRKRSTAEEVQQLKDLALETARSLSPGFRKGDVMKRSGSRADLGRALSLLVKEGKLAKQGDRRKARYWVN